MAVQIWIYCIPNMWNEENVRLAGNIEDEASLENVR